MSQAPEDRLAWSQPGIFAVVDGVHRLPLPLPNDGLRAVNVYVIESSDGLTLIDSGWALDAAERQLTQSLRTLGYTLDDVRRFLVTHAHRDHYTQAIVLRERYGWEVALGRGEQPTIDVLNQDTEARSRFNRAELLACGADELVRALEKTWNADDFDESQYAYPDNWIERGASFMLGTRRLDAIETPGHTRGHLVFRDPAASILFAGDHVLPQITPSIGFEAAPASSPLADYLASLSVIRELPDTMLLPAHGPVATSTHARVDELLEHHRVRLDDSVRAVEWGARTTFEIASALRWTRRERTLQDLAVFDQMLAVGETSAHLKVLVSMGRLTVDAAVVRGYSPA